MRQDTPPLLDLEQLRLEGIRAQAMAATPRKPIKVRRRLLDDGSRKRPSARRSSKGESVRMTLPLPN